MANGMCRTLAIAAARRYRCEGARRQNIHYERRAQAGTNAEYLAEAAVRSTATGRPATGSSRQ